MSEFRAELDTESQLHSAEKITTIINSVDWFCNVGKSATETIRKHTDAHLAGLGFHDANVQIATDIEQLERCIKSEFDRTWMEAESAASQRILTKVGDPESQSIERIIRRLVEQQSPLILTAAENQLRTSSRYLARVATGSASETCFLYALEMMVRTESSGVFTSKFELFRMGRWPLCMSSGSYYLY